jgi:hypothetical protein
MIPAARIQDGRPPAKSACFGDSDFGWEGSFLLGLGELEVDRSDLHTEHPFALVANHMEGLRFADWSSHGLAMPATLTRDDCSHLTASVCTDLSSLPPRSPVFLQMNRLATASLQIRDYPPSESATAAPDDRVLAGRLATSYVRPRHRSAESLPARRVVPRRCGKHRPEHPPREEALRSPH